LKNLLKEQVVILIATIEGMTSAWHSLSSSAQSKRIKLANFLHAEGIDSKKLPGLNENND